MVKKTITYVDYNGETRKEDHWFHLSKAELIMMENSVIGGLKQKMEKIIQSQNNVEIMELFKDLIHRSYGIKSDDGRRFIKSDEISTEFEQTEAYSELVIELLSNADEASEFIKAMLPNGLLKDADLKALPTA